MRGRRREGGGGRVRGREGGGRVRILEGRRGKGGVAVIPPLTMH